MRLLASSVRVVLKIRYAVLIPAVPTVSWKQQLACTICGFAIASAVCDDKSKTLFLITSFDYLRSGDARQLKRVFYHNAMDVLAMVALLNHIAQMLDDPLTFAQEHGLDLIALGKLFEDLGRLEDAARLYERGLEHELAEEIFRQTVERLSFVQRRRGEILSAVEWWRAAARYRQVYALVELAKYYEHTLRDYAQAAQWTRDALAIVTAPEASPDARRKWQADLEHRLARVEAKREKQTTAMVSHESSELGARCCADRSASAVADPSRNYHPTLVRRNRADTASWE